MRIVGEWLLCDDGFTRPTLHAQVPGSDGRTHADRFLVESGVDRSVFSAVFWRRLQLPPDPLPPDMALVGVGGGADFALVTTEIELRRDAGGPARVRGQFAAFTNPQATDLSVLGRDVLDNFDVILSRRRNEILLLAPSHRYAVSRT